MDRRHFLTAIPALAGLPALTASPAVAAMQPGTAAHRGIRITGMETVSVRATARTVWIFVRLTTNRGLTGLAARGESPD